MRYAPFDMAKRLWDKGAAIDQVVHDFTVGSDPEFDLELAEWDILASAAHAQLLRKLDIVSADELSRIQKALASLLLDARSGKFTIPRELEDVHTALEAKLTEQLGETGKKIHTGRSRNDQVLTAARLYLKQTILSACESVMELSDKLEARVRSDGKLPLPGYTHFQKAMPASVAMWLQSFYEWCIEILADGFRVFESIDCNPLGTASGFGVPIKLDREFSTTLLSFARVQRNPMYAQSSRGRFELKVMRWLSDIAALIEKFSCDLMLFTTSEFAFCKLPDSLTTGSSIMPQKRNPDVVELMRAGASQIRAREGEVLQIISKLPSNYNRDFQMTKEPLVRSARSVMSMLAAMVRTVEGVQFDSERLKAAMSDDLYVTYELYRDVRGGKSFRDAYQDAAKRIAANSKLDPSIRTDFSLIEESLDNEFAQSLKEKLALSKKLLALTETFSNIQKSVGL